MSNESIKSVNAIRYNDGNTSTIQDPVIEETTVTVYLNRKKLLSLVASPNYLTELGAGVFVASGIAKDITDVSVNGTDIFVTGTQLEEGKTLVSSSSGGFETKNPVHMVHSSLTITPEEIFLIRESLNGEDWDLTGGLHCTALYHNHKIVGLFTDIGRHNTVDKAIGYMILHHINPAECVLGCTGRQPHGMVQKAANAGIPLIVSRAASTTAGIATADDAGITLICFTRNRRFTIYTHPERIIHLF